MTDAWEMHQAETGLNPGPVWRDRGIIINTLTERNQALEERVAELEGSCQKLRDDYQGALARETALRARIEALTDSWPDYTKDGRSDYGRAVAQCRDAIRAAL